MGVKEKEREDGYWRVFAETGTMPPIPMEFAQDGNVSYALDVLHAQYNPLTKVLFGEALSRAGKLPEADGKSVVDAVGWIRPKIFSSKYNFPKRKEMADAFAKFCKDAVCESFRDEKVVAEDGYQAAWEWVKAATAVYKTLPNSASQVSGLIDSIRHIAKSGAWVKIRADVRLRPSILFWLVKLMAKTGQEISAMAFVKIFKFDGLADLPASCFERKQIIPKPDKGADHFPSTAEEIAKNVYKVFKSLSPQQRNLEVETLKWAVDFMVGVCDRCPDEWGEYRIGKVLVWLGDLAAAKERIMPIALKKQKEFWIWDLLGDLFPEQRKECVARALLCQADERYTKNLKRESEMLGLGSLGKSELQDLADRAEHLLLDGIEPVKGVLIASYKNQEGKFRVKFRSASAPDPKPVSPVAIRFPRGMADGTPVWLYRAPEDESDLVGVKLREEGEPWDVMPSDKVTFHRVSKNGKLIFISETNEYSADATVFSLLGPVKAGDVFSIRYSSRMKDGLELRMICQASRCLDKTSLVYRYEGALKLMANCKTAFVEDVYLGVELVDRLRARGCAEGSPVCGLAIILPPRMETDKFGRQRMRRRKNALTAEILGGEALERYRNG